VTEMYESGELAEVLGVEASGAAPAPAEPEAAPLAIENNLNRS
jgi:hypothetical protein